jgi:hypothetical protein
MSTSSKSGYEVLTGQAALDRMVTKDKHRKMVQETRVLQSVIKNNPDAINRLCKISAVCGSRLDPYCCAPIDRKVLQEIMLDFAVKLLAGIPQAEDLKESERDDTPCWKIGIFGSTWIDLDAESYDLDYVRVAYYHHKDKKDKPYHFQITCEKAAD